MPHFTATAQDCFNYMANGLTSNAQIQYVVSLSESIDYAKLKDAVKSILATEPVLSSLFAISNDIPVWKTAKSHTICSHTTVAGDVQPEIDAFLALELDAAKEPPLKVCLVENGVSYAIAIKISHAACDGSGSKYLLKLLADTYTSLATGMQPIHPTHIPERGTDALYKAFGIADIEKHFDPSAQDMTSTWGMPVRSTPQQQHFKYKLLRLSPDELSRMQRFAKANRATINTVLIAIYQKALVELLRPANKMPEVQFMVDLRKHTGISQTVCNLSGIANVAFSANATLSEAVQHAQVAIAEQLSVDKLIQGAIGCDLALSQGFGAAAEFVKADWQNIQSTGLCTPMISNLGIIDSSIAFGNSRPTDITLVSPAFYGPAFMLGVSTFAGRLTLCASYYSPSIGDKDVERLMKHIQNIAKEISIQ